MVRSRKALKKEKEELERKISKVNSFIASGDFVKAMNKANEILEIAIENDLEKLINQTKQKLEEIRSLIAKRYNTEQLNNLGPIEEEKNYHERLEKLFPLLKRGEEFKFKDFIKEIQDQIDFCNDKIKQEMKTTEIKKRDDILQKHNEIENLVQNENYKKARRIAESTFKEAEKHDLHDLAEKSTGLLKTIQEKLDVIETKEYLREVLPEVKILVENEDYKGAQKVLEDAVKKAERYNLSGLLEDFTNNLEEVKEIRKQIREEKLKEIGGKIKKYSKKTVSKTKKAVKKSGQTIKQYLDNWREGRKDKLPLKSQFNFKKGKLKIRNGIQLSYKKKRLFWNFYSTGWGIFLFISLPFFILIMGFFGINDILQVDILLQIICFWGPLANFIYLIIMIIIHLIIVIATLRNNNKKYKKEFEESEKIQLKLIQAKQQVKNYIPKVANAENLKEINHLYNEINQLIETDLKDLEVPTTLKGLSEYVDKNHWNFYKELKPRIRELEKNYFDVFQTVESIKLFKDQLCNRVAYLLRNNLAPGTSISLDSTSKLIGLNQDTTLDVIEELREEKKLPGIYIDEEKRFIRHYTPPIPYSEMRPSLDKDELLEFLRKKVDYLPICDILFFLQMENRLELEEFLSLEEINDIKLTKEYVVIKQKSPVEVSE